MSKADEFAQNIIKTFGRKPKDRTEARILVTRYMGEPKDIGFQIHENVADAMMGREMTTETKAAPTAWLLTWPDGSPTFFPANCPPPKVLPHPGCTVTPLYAHPSAERTCICHEHNPACTCETR